MKKILTLCLILLGTVCYAQKAYKNPKKQYIPKSYKGGSLRWLEFGPSIVFANVIDKSGPAPVARPAYGFGVKSRQLMNRKGFTYVNLNVLTGETERIRLDPFSHDELIKRYGFVNINAGISFYMIGDDKSTFAFSPMSFGFGLMTYDVDFEFNNPALKDENILGTNFGVNSVTSIHLRLEKVYVFLEGEFFSSLSNGEIVNIQEIDEDFKPSWFAAMLQLGIRYNL